MAPREINARTLSLPLLVCVALLLSAAPRAAASADFPVGWLPFDSIYAIIGPNAAGDRLVVGHSSDTDLFSRRLRDLPRPDTAHLVFSTSPIQLAPGLSVSKVYIPTPTEIAGVYEPFAGLLMDPLTNRPFPQGYIPTWRLYEIWAFRIPSDAVLQHPAALPHIAFGALWKTTILLRNEGDQPTAATLTFFDDDGRPLPVPIGTQTTSQITVTIPAHGQSAVETHGTNADRSGWAALDYTGGAVKCQGIFLWQQTGGGFSEAAAPVVPHSQLVAANATMPFDNTGDAFSGYGFANVAGAPATLQLQAYDDSGALLGEYTQSLPAFGHTAFLLAKNLPQTQGRRGVLVIGGAAPLGFKFIQGGARFSTWLP